MRNVAKLDKVSIPKYTLGEEIFNAVSHGVGASFGIVALVITIVFAAKHGNPAGVVAASIYGATMIIMYTISCLYHALSPRLKAKKVFRVLDHCDIYVFIAGCYTPFCISLIGGALGWTIFGVIWGCAILGVLLNAIDVDKFNIPSFILYLVMGWMIVISFNTLANIIATPGLVLLIVGGGVYTIGSIFYACGHKLKYIHSVFHLFVLAASILQFFSILYAI